MNNRLTEAYISILKEELLMATGCTEPIAIAYCAAKMRDILGGEPERIEAEVSGNILKNVKSVIVPNTGGLKGINAAIAAGIIAGRAEKVLQVISYVTQEEHSRIREYMEVTPLAVSCSDNGRMLDIRLTGYRGGDSAMVHIANNHSNIIREERNGAVLMELPPSDSAEDNLQDKSVLNIEDIVRFADTVDVELVKPLLDNQIRCNSAIAEEGLRGDWGANVGRVLLSEFGSDIKNEARAYAAAASDARMSGCELPVVIVTGSGNQGITASVPVIKIRKAHRRQRRAALQGPAGIRPCHHTPKDRHRQAVSLLRRGQRGLRRGRGHSLSFRRGLQGHSPYHSERRGHTLRHYMRRGKTLLRRKDSLRSGGRHIRLLYVRQRPAVPGRRRHSCKGRREHHTQRRPAGKPGYEADGPGDTQHNDRRSVPVTGSHVGPDTVALFFMGSDRNI